MLKIRLALLGTQARRRRVALGTLVVAFVLSVLPEHSWADSCSDIMGGAHSGRPSNWETLFTSWQWGDDACWKQWPDATTSKKEAEEICEATGVRLHFRRDTGGGEGVHTCVFQPKSSEPNGAGKEDGGNG